MKNGSGNAVPVTANALHEAAAPAQPDMNVDEIRDLLDVTEKGQVKSSITNAELILYQKDEGYEERTGSKEKSRKEP